MLTPFNFFFCFEPQRQKQYFEQRRRQQHQFTAGSGSCSNDRNTSIPRQSLDILNFINLSTPATPKCKPSRPEDGNYLLVSVIILCVDHLRQCSEPWLIPLLSFLSVSLIEKFEDLDAGFNSLKDNISGVGKVSKFMIEYDLVLFGSCSMCDVAGSSLNNKAETTSSKRQASLSYFHVMWLPKLCFPWIVWLIELHFL